MMTCSLLPRSMKDGGQATDDLAKMGSSRANVPSGIFVHLLDKLTAQARVLDVPELCDE